MHAQVRFVMVIKWSYQLQNGTATDKKVKMAVINIVQNNKNDNATANVKACFFKV